ncbi:MAG: NAD(P)-dependent oxidoreductase [Alphaproteobacteria bacterium]|nr:MAG: NAD(P)-dependent oxidoreductase [Alphaproteobacteria bacterium]
MVRVAILGLGLMGRPMARRLAAAFGTVSAWNRSPVQHRGDLAGIAIAERPEQSVADAEILITMLTDGAAVAEVLFSRGAARAMRPGTLIVDMSSIALDEARDHARRLAGMGLRHLDAPVSGGTAGAEAGTLAIMAGGAAEDFSRAQPVFAALGRAVHLGPSGAGQVAKLANQVIVALTIGGVAEGLALARAGGVDLAGLVDAIGGGLAASTVLERYGPRMIAGDFEPRGRSSTHLKDLQNALRHAASLGLDLPLSTVVEHLFARLLGCHGDVDHSGLILAIEGEPAGDRAGGAA